MSHPPPHAMPQLSILTPLGDITVSEEDGAIVALDWGRGRDREETPLLRRAAAVLQDYFDGAGGVSVRCAHSFASSPSGVNGGRPVSSSYSTTPKE